MFPQRPMPPMGPMQPRGMMRVPGRMPMNGGQPLNGFMNQGARSPFGGMLGGQNFGMQQAAGRAGGGGIKGLLSKILPFGQGAGGQAAGGAARGLAGLGGAAQGGSGIGGAAQGLQSLANPSNISGMLGNVQKALGMAQQVTPMIQQYGPLVRNLPAMYRIYSQLKSGGSDNESENEETTAEAEPVQEEQHKPVQQRPKRQSAAKAASIESNPGEEQAETVKEASPKKTRGSSAPRLYV